MQLQICTIGYCPKIAHFAERADIVDLFAERTDLMIDAMNGTDAVKLSYIFETVSKQTAIQSASVYLQVSSAFSESGSNTTFRDMLRATKGLTADVWCDQNMIDRLEDLVREPELHAKKVSGRDDIMSGKCQNLKMLN